MRTDMGRVVIERPRKGSSNKSPKIRHFPGRINAEGDYDGLSRLPSSRYKIYGFVPKILDKSFTDVLGPLRRYLRKNVGRPWDKVHGEAKRVLKAGGWGVQHVFEAHFLAEVDREVYQHENGTLVSCRYRFLQRVEGFYVHPKTGLLRYAPPTRWKPAAQPTNIDLIPLDDSRYYVRIRGLWFIASYQRFDTLPALRQTELLSRGALRQWPNLEKAGKLWICRLQKSCNKKEVREINRRLNQ